MKYLYHPQKSGRRLNWGTARTGTFRLLRTSFASLAVASAFISEAAGTEKSGVDLSRICFRLKIYKSSNVSAS